MYKAREYLAAAEPPQFEDLDGVVHTGATLSFPQMTKLRADMIDAMAGGDDSAEKWIREQLAPRLFPGDTTIADKLLELPSGGVVEAVTDFFKSGRRTKTPSQPAPANPTSGNA